MHSAVSTGFLALIVSCAMLFLLRPLAARVHLVDKPSQRKKHTGTVPLIGGLSAFAGLLVAWLISMPLSNGFGIYLLCSFLLVGLGALDDARDIPARFRLWAQVTLGAFLAYGSGVYLTGFGNLLGFGDISLGLLGPAVTVAAVIGATNAYNMMDGIDGLAGSMSLVTLGALAFLFSQAPGFSLPYALALTIMMALVPYMAANLSLPRFRAKIFMGEAGSLVIGFSVVWLLVNGAQPEAGAFRPVTALWVCAVPLMDMVAIMIRRARKGESMMRPDREHLHHIFLRAGFSQHQALLIITTVAAVLAGVGLMGELFHVPEWVMFGLFMLTFAAYSWSIGHVWRLLVIFRQNQAVEGTD